MATPREAAPVTDTPEFKAALAEMQAAFDKKLDAAMARFATPAGADAAGDGAVKLADRLSVQLAKLTGQGIGQSYVDPEIIVRRKDAHRRMREALQELRAAGDKPKWKLVGQIHMPLGEVGYAIIQPLYRDAAKKPHPTEISHFAEPNLAMRPANAAAERIWDLFCQSIGRNATGDVDDEDMDTDGFGGKLGSVGDIALSWSGAVVQGSAAAVMRRNDPNAVTIEQGDDAANRKVQIFTSMPAVEMA